MKTSKISRRKFLTGMGVAAGAAAAMPALTSIARRSRRVTASKRRPSILDALGTLKPVKVISREAETYRLPLSSRTV